MTALFKNRYKNLIEFTDLEDGSVQMIIHSDLPMSAGFNEGDKCLRFVDPSGGPFIQVGMDIGKEFFPDNKSRVIASILDLEGKIILQINK